MHSQGLGDTGASRSETHQHRVPGSHTPRALPGGKTSVTGERDSWGKDARRLGWIHGHRDLERAWGEDTLHPGQRLRSLTQHRVPERDPRTHLEYCEGSCGTHVRHNWSTNSGTRSHVEKMREGGGEGRGEGDRERRHSNQGAWGSRLWTCRTVRG